ncbi:MAG: phage tail tape measure protein [Proteobacteria bacterium]|nr:phage tail tape measure protein [Pseudomonadota bacterium]
MRQFFSSVSTLALLLCLTTQPIFSMENEEGESQDKTASLRTVSPSREGDSADVGYVLYTIVRGNGQTHVALPKELELHHHYKFPTYSAEAYFDLMDKKLPQLLNINKLRGQLPKDRILNLCEEFLKNVGLPFTLFIEDTATFLVIMSQGTEEGIGLSAPLEVKDKRPHTRERNLIKKEKEKTAAAFVASGAPILTPPSPLKGISVADLIRISEKVCNTRVSLLKTRESLRSGSEQTEACLTECVDVYKRFLVYLNNFRGKVRLPQNHILFLRTHFDAYCALTPLFESLKEVYLLHNENEKYIETVGIQGEYLSLHLTVTQELLKIFPENPVIIGSRRTLLDGLYTLAIVEYGNYLAVDPVKAACSYGKAEKYNDQLKEAGEQALYAKNRAQLHELKVKKASVVQRGSARTQEAKRLLDALKKFEENKSQDVIFSDHREFMAFLRKSMHETARLSSQEMSNVQRQIIALENKILDRRGNSFLSLPDVKAFYRQYKKDLLGRTDELMDMTNLLVGFFTASGQFEQGINHIDALKEAYEGVDLGGFSKEMDIKRSVLRALQGFPEDFLKIWESAIEGTEQLRKERLERKKQREEKRMAIIKEAVRTAQAANSLSYRSQVTSEKTPESSEKTPEILSTLATSAQLSGFSGSVFDTESPKETKEEREKRHRLSLERKEQEKKRIEAQQRQQKEPVVYQRAAAAAAADEDFSIEQEKEGYIPFDLDIQEGLTTLQRRLEHEMETNSWNFTRDELRAYYESFGCKISQRGSHVKAALPTFEMIELPDGTPLVINFNFEEFELQGGSFTFAKWRHTVPQYLRSQILEARRRIQAFKRVVNDEVRRVMENKN